MTEETKLANLLYAAAECLELHDKAPHMAVEGAAQIAVRLREAAKKLATPPQREAGTPDWRKDGGALYCSVCGLPLNALHGSCGGTASYCAICGRPLHSGPCGGVWRSDPSVQGAYYVLNRKIGLNACHRVAAELDDLCDAVAATSQREAGGEPVAWRLGLETDEGSFKSMLSPRERKVGDRVHDDFLEWNVRVSEPLCAAVLPTAPTPERSILDAVWPGNDGTYREFLAELAEKFDQAIAHKMIGQICLVGPGGNISVYAGMGSMITDLLEGRR